MTAGRTKVTRGAYVTPRLIRYGRLRSLTTAGTGPTPEAGSQSKTKRP
jgi:hypothetical protein